MSESAFDPVSESDRKFVFERCEKFGEANTRIAITGNYFGPEHRRLAELWLRLQEDERQDKLSRENGRTSRRTELAAWLATAISLLGLVVGILQLVRT
jgi:hypothetical protein